MKRNLWIVSLLVLVFGSILPSLASDIDPIMCIEDRRLQRPVTIAERRIPLGDLLKRLSRQTGAPILIDPQNPASGIMVEVYCQQIPAVDLLNALRSAFSSADAAWAWTRVGKLGTFFYQLAPTARSKQRSERLHQYVRKALDDFARLMIAFAQMSPEQRKSNRHRITTLIGQPDDQWADALVKSDRWSVIRLFSEAVPPEEQAAALAGQKKAKIPVRDLPPSVQQLAQAAWATYNVSENGIPVPEPQTLHFYTMALSIDVPAVAPTVWYDLGEGRGSASFLGGNLLEEMVKAATERAWMLPGDKADSPSALRRVPAVKNPPRPGPDLEVRPGIVITQPFERPMDLRLSQLAQGASLPLVAVLPAQQGNDPGAPAGDTVQGFFSKQTFQSLHPMSKWRGNILIVNYPEWFQEDYETTTVPFAKIE